MNEFEEARSGAGALRVTPGQANYILGLVTFAYAMAYVDRQLLNLLVDPIRGTLDITDTQFSFIQGMAFVLAYLAAVPVFGRLVDVASRRNILIFGVFSWSLFTTLSGFVSNYYELFAARMGVGVTEACVFPAAWSMIGDAFPPKKIPRAMAVFLLGPPLGSGFSLIAGGIIIAFASGLAVDGSILDGLQPWQLAFVITGIPGMLFALFLLTMKEPPRQVTRAVGVEQAKPGLAAVAAFLRANARIYGLIYFANGMLAMVQLAIPSWLPAFLIRSHGLTAVETGLTLGIVSLATSISGSLSGAAASGWFSRRGHIDAPFRAAAWMSVPLIAASFLVPVTGATGAFVAAGAVIFATAFIAGLLSAGTTMATPPRMRGLVASLYSFAAQIIGYMIGPFLVAQLTDRYFVDPTMVGYSLQIVMTAGAIVLAICMFALRAPFRRILERDQIVVS